MSKKRTLSTDLFAELFQTERSAVRHPRREAERLGPVPPATALRAVAAHADEALADVARLAKERGLHASAVGQVAGEAFSVARHLVVDRVLSAEQSFRGTLLGLRHGVDVVRLLRSAADEEGDAPLVDWCDRWLSVRLRLVAGVEAELGWFGHHPDVARNGGSRSKRAMSRVLALVGASALAMGAACTDVAIGAGGDATSPTSPGGTETGPRGSAPVPGEGGASGADGGAGEGGAGGDAGEVLAPYVHFDINHVLSTGQSNAVANDGKPVVSTSQPYDNVMFDVGVMTGSQCDGDGCKRYDVPSAFVPLVEGDTFFPGSAVETMSSSMANTATRLARAGALAGTGHASHDLLVSLHGRSGNSYWCLRKGGCPWWEDRGYVKPWDDAMRQVADGKRLADAAGKSYAVRAITAIHGEHDHYAWSSGDSLFPLPRTDGQGDLADYGDALAEWQRDYEAGVKAITGQTVSPPLLVSQYSHWNDVPTTVISFQQLRAHVQSNGKVVVVGPTYPMPYSSSCLHFTGEGERWLGEYFGKVYTRIVVERKTWEPLRPLALVRNGAAVTVSFAVPKPPLVLDTETVKDPGSYGFEAVDAAGARLAIASVALAGPTSVTVTLADPAAPAARLRYAYTFTGCGGSGTIARGNLRDSDDTPSAIGKALWNWSVHFDEAIP